ncbi:MAG: zinc metalloprotease HtpX [Pseudomonadota bacterium]
MNYLKTAMLLAFMTGILVAMGAAAGGQVGMVIAFAAALAMNFYSFWQSDSLVLKMFRGREVDAQSAPEYYAMVKDLAARAELPMPRVYILPQEQPNAFATGRSPERSAVACSKGLMRVLNREELAGVIAHELAHIKNRDTLIMTIAATIGGAISMLAQWMQFSMMFGGGDNRSSPLGWVGVLATALLAPFAAMLVQMAISRSREYQADELGARICGNPVWLASALDKIAGPRAKQIVNETAESIPAAAHLFIVNPLTGRGVNPLTGRGVDNLFSTHPNTENRIAALSKLAQDWGTAGASSFTAGSSQPQPSAQRDRSGTQAWVPPHQRQKSNQKPKRSSRSFSGPWSRKG